MRKIHLQVLTEIGPFRKQKMKYYHPASLSMEEGGKWLQEISEGSIGCIEVFLKGNSLSIQLASEFLPFFPETEPYFYSFPSPINDVEVFKFNLKKPALYPINSDCLGSGWISPVEHFDGEAWIQLLFQKDKNDKWKTHLKQQYEDYLKGIDYPSTLPFIRDLQLKIADWGNKIPTSINPINSFEEKQHQPFFHCRIRGFVKGEKKERENLIQTLHRRLSHRKSENEWVVTVRSEQENIQLEKWRSTKSLFISGNLLSEKELMGLLPVVNLEKPKTNKKVQPKTMVKKTNIYPIFQFLPKGTIEEEIFMTDLFEQELNGALEKLGVIKEEGLQIIGFEQGPTLIRLNILLPKGIRLSDLQKVITDWQTELGITDLSVFQGKEKGSGTLTLPRKNRQTIFLRDLVDTEEFRDFAKDKVLPFVVGTTETGDPLYEDITRVRHLLVAGTTGSGKSVWLLQLILTLLLWVTPNQLMMYLIDPKRVEFPGFSSFKNVKVYTEVEEAKQLLQSLINLMESRYEQLGKEGVRNIAQYNRKVKDAPLPYVVTVIDEFSDFIMQDEEGIVEESIVRLAQKARACGIHLIITTQRPSVDVVTGLIKANLPSRVVFKCSGRNDYSTVLDQKPPFNLLGNGDGVCLMEGKVLTRFQGPLIAKEEENMDQIIKDYGKNQSGEAPLSLEIREERNSEETTGPLDQLKHYIAFTGETRITHLRKQMKMRMNDVKDMMQLLVDEGWLEAPKTRNSGYKLILSKEEREQYLKQG